jgi:metal-responsive CopG/Arc/MetJ family transcriptional regulator
MPKTSKLVEIRIFVPKIIVKRIDRKMGILGNTRSEIIRHILVDAFTKKVEAD